MLSATITGLAENTEYEVQVRATNAEGTSGWSPSGSGATDANAAPSFDSAATFGVEENGTAVGTVVASDNDTGDDITGYALSGGADQSFFSIDRDTGVLTFKAAPNYEDPQDQDAGNTYEVEVQATSGTGDREKTATQAITVTVGDDKTEAPSAPDAPNVSAESVTSLNVSWAAPDNAGPEITDYDHRYRTSSPQGAWVEVTNTTITVLSATITGLAENTEYEVQVRATNAEGTSGWSPSGSGATDANAAPSFVPRRRSARRRTRPRWARWWRRTTTADDDGHRLRAQRRGGPELLLHRPRHRGADVRCAAQLRGPEGREHR